MNKGKIYCIGVGPGDPELKAMLAESGAEVHAVSNCGMPGEAVYDDVAAIPDDAGYFTVVVAKKGRGGKNGI